MLYHIIKIKMHAYMLTHTLVRPGEVGTPAADSELEILQWNTFYSHLIYLKWSKYVNNFINVKANTVIACLHFKYILFRY
jgi:hypothetical protein